MRINRGPRCQSGTYDSNENEQEAFSRSSVDLITTEMKKRKVAGNKTAIWCAETYERKRRSIAVNAARAKQKSTR